MTSDFASQKFGSGRGDLPERSRLGDPLSDAGAPVRPPACGLLPTTTFALEETPSVRQQALTSLEDAFGIGFTVGNSGGRHVLMAISGAQTQP